MYTLTWNKYLPIIRILLKRAAGGPQTFKLNTSDFDKAGSVKKPNSRFTIQFRPGRMEAVTGMQALGKDLATSLLQDPVVKQLFSENEYLVVMDSKYTLTVTMVPKPESEEPLPIAPEKVEQ
jgi:hypothetical protein